MPLQARISNQKVFDVDGPTVTVKDMLEALDTLDSSDDASSIAVFNRNRGKGWPARIYVGTQEK